MSKTSTGADSPGPQIPVDAIDDMLEEVARAADDLGLRPGDRLYPICSSLMTLCRTLATSIQASHDAHARAIASNQDKLLASQETVQRHLEMQTDRLQQRAEEQIRQVEDHFAEMKKQRAEILNRYSIESEGDKFFKKLDEIHGTNVNKISRIINAQSEHLDKTIEEFNRNINTSIENIPRDLSKAIADKMGDTGVIATFISETLTREMVKAVRDKFLAFACIGVLVGFILTIPIIFDPISKITAHNPIPPPVSKDHGIKPW